MNEEPITREVKLSKGELKETHVSLGHPPCHKAPRLLSGTTRVLLDPTMTLWGDIGDGALPRKVEI